MSRMNREPQDTFVVCAGAGRAVHWAGPLPRNADVTAGDDGSSTLRISAATVANTRFYACRYGEQPAQRLGPPPEDEDEDEDEDEAVIYVFVPDPDAPFVPEEEEDEEAGEGEEAALPVFPMYGDNFIIPCRASHPHAHATLLGVPGGDEVMTVAYDNKIGFIGSVPVGRYRCQITAPDGRTFHSPTYAVQNPEAESEDFHVEVRASEEVVRAGQPAVDAVQSRRASSSPPGSVWYSLNMAAAGPQDSGEYECSVTHAATGVTRSGSVAISVVEENSFVALGPQAVSWRRDGEPLPESYYLFTKTSRISGNRYESVVTLRHPLEKDSGNYSITALSGTHSAHFSFMLRVKGLVVSVSFVAGAACRDATRDRRSLWWPLQRLFSLTCRGHALLTGPRPSRSRARRRTTAAALFVSARLNRGDEPPPIPHVKGEDATRCRLRATALGRTTSGNLSVSSVQGRCLISTYPEEAVSSLYVPRDPRANVHDAERGGAAPAAPYASHYDHPARSRMRGLPRRT
ncbi:hypothetical protein CRUP_012680 [Coryphaenoides rupestris]|nr:hypothetical protein CRUP_012680 [Coryphaenoides rupestris]